MLKHLIEKYRDTLPDWDDKKGVAKLADELITHKDTVAQRFTDFADYAEQQINKDEFFRFKHAEAAAVEAVLQGRPGAPLARLLIEHPEWAKPSSKSLALEALAGKHKRKAGGQKTTREEKFAATPTHMAAANAKILEQSLKRLYPKKKGKARARAIEIVAARADIEPEMLRNYIERSRKDRRRIV